MDPRHTLYRTFEKLQVEPKAKMSARTDQEAAQVQATSGVTPESIEKKESLGAVYVEIADLSGKSHVILSELFLLLQQIHRPLLSGFKSVVFLFLSSSSAPRHRTCIASMAQA
jgi:hypothetical protein